MKRIVAGCMLALAAAGCCNFCEPKACEGELQQEVFEVGRPIGPIVLDGKLDEAAWAAAPEYTTHLILNIGGCFSKSIFKAYLFLSAKASPTGG